MLINYKEWTCKMTRVIKKIVWQVSTSLKNVNKLALFRAMMTNLWFLLQKNIFQPTELIKTKVTKQVSISQLNSHRLIFKFRTSVSLRVINFRELRKSWEMSRNTIKYRLNCFVIMNKLQGNRVRHTVRHGLTKALPWTLKFRSVNRPAKPPLQILTSLRRQTRCICRHVNPLCTNFARNTVKIIIHRLRPVRNWMLTKILRVSLLCTY